MTASSQAGNDVFVSYAHDDNLVPEGAGSDLGWVSTLAANLKAASSTADARLFIDHSLKSGDEFPEILQREVASSRLLMVILSQNYINSKWCGRELDYFLSVQGRSLDAPQGVVVVELAPFFRLTDVPENIQRLRATFVQAKFWHQPGASGPIQLGHPTPRFNEPQLYWQRVTALAEALRSRLNTLQLPRTPAATTARPSTGSILLADVTEDLESDRQAVKMALVKEGITVLPKGDYVGLSFDAFQSAFNADLAECGLFVQMLSRTPGRLLAGYPARLPRLQSQLASQTAGSILQWCEVLPRQDSQIEIGHASLFKTPHIRETNVEALKDEVISRLETLTRERLAEARRIEDVRGLAGKVVFVDDEFGDPILGARIREIIKRERCSIRSWPKALPLGQDQHTGREVLRICKGGLTVYADKRDHPIVHNRLVYFLNQVAEDRLLLSRWGIYFGPPKDKGTVVSDFGIDSEDVVGIAGMEQLNETGLVSFLQSL